METDAINLRLVEIVADQGNGRFLSKAVFSKESITVQLRGLQRLHFQLPVGAVVYVSIEGDALEAAHFIPTWRNPMRLDPTETDLEKQRRALDARYIAAFSQQQYKKIHVYSESRDC